MRTVLLLACAGLPSCAPDAGATAPVTPPAAEAVADAVSEAPVAEAPPPAPVELRATPTSRPIRTRPAPDAPLRGATSDGGAFRVLERVEGPGCPAGWGRLEADGWLCLEGSVEATDPPVRWPPLIQFDPPEPTEFERYLATGEYDHRQPEALVPAVYAKRWRRFKGRLYASEEAFSRGEAPIGELERGVGMKYHFERIVENPIAPLLVREDGKVARLDDVYLYPVSRHQGRDLVADPLPAGLWPAFAIDYEGAPVRAAPSDDAAVLATLPYHAPLVIRDTPVAPGWWEVPDAGGPGVPGYVNDWRSIRHPVADPGPRPEGVGDQDLWVDVELGQQALMVRRGDALEYFTVVSTGAAPMGTPKGTYRITGTWAHKDMASREGADDPYHVEDVPWTLVFRPSYALHGAYWHWGFGRTASHGCVNLAPRDAKWLFDRVGPALPDGWLTIHPREDEGTVVRIRRGADAGLDRRADFPSPAEG